MPQDENTRQRNHTGLSDNYKMSPLGYTKQSKGNDGVKGDHLATLRKLQENFLYHITLLTTVFVAKTACIVLLTF